MCVISGMERWRYIAHARVLPVHDPGDCWRSATMLKSLLLIKIRIILPKVEHVFVKKGNEIENDVRIDKLTLTRIVKKALNGLQECWLYKTRQWASTQIKNRYLESTCWNTPRILLTWLPTIFTSLSNFKKKWWKTALQTNKERFRDCVLESHKRY